MERELTAMDTTPATHTDHLGGWVMENLATGEGTTWCECGWVAPSKRYKEGDRQQLEHRRQAMAQEDAAAQAGFIPESWRSQR